jgi:beta-mannosidase
VQSFSFEVHDNQIAYWGNHTQIDLAIEQWMGLNVQQMSLEDYAYYGGLLQGEALQEYIRNFRRRMFDSSSAIFWMYNDCWPATRSWTIVDYYGRRTPSFHPVRRAFLPLAVFIAVEDNQVKIFCANEGAQQNLKLEFGLCSLAGGYPIRIKKSSKVSPNSSNLLATFPLVEWERAGIHTHCAFAILRSGSGDEISRDVFFLPFFKEMIWPKADVKVKWVDGKAIFNSDAFAWRVCLDLDGRALPDNFFDVLPGIPTVLDWPEELGEPKILRTGNLIST